MRSKNTRNWLLIGTLALLIFLLIGGSNWTDRNYAPGSAWPYIWGWVAGISAAALLGAWVYWWNKKQ